MGLPEDFKDCAIEDTLPQTVVRSPILFLASAGEMLSKDKATREINSNKIKRFSCNDFIDILFY